MVKFVVLSSKSDLTAGIPTTCSVHPKVSGRKFQQVYIQFEKKKLSLKSIELVFS